MLRRLIPMLAIAVLVAGVLAAPRHLISRTATAPDFVHMEAGQVHPATLTPSGDRLLVVNTPDARLAVFDVSAGQLTRIGDIPVGLEPVAVAALDDSTAWVVNWLSDDISVVDLHQMHVRATIRVGDEPMDVLFAGTPTRAYVSVSQEDAIKVYDPATRTLQKTIAIPGSEPRSLARTADGLHVYVAMLDGGNKTTVLSAAAAGDSIDIANDPEYPRDPGNKLGHLAPKVGAILKYLTPLGDGAPNGAGWYDFNYKLWNSKVRYQPLDHDVVEIATATDEVSRSFGASGSTNFALAVRASDGRIAVTNIDGRGINVYEPRISGYVVESQANFIVNATGTLSKRILNPHVVYDATPGPPAELDSALAQPVAVAYSSNGQRAYVAAMGSNKLAVLNPDANGNAGTNFVKARISTVAGPSGLVVDDANGRLFVVGRYHNQVQALSTTNFSQLAIASIGYDPTPDAIVNGRRVFYAGFTSGHGEQSCASCHVFADEDGLAWDLGDPNGPYVPGTLPLHGFDPQKGPMVTQSLRGLTNTEPFHWRGDRANFGAFNGAITSLLGRGTQLPDSQMTAMSDFIMPLVYGPNPNERLDRSLPDAPPGVPSALRGQLLYTTALLDTAGGTPVACEHCHTSAGFTPGTNRQMVPRETILDPQDLKVPHMRNLYKKTGFTHGVGDTPKRLIGYSHNGTFATIEEFLHRDEFAFDADTSISNPQRRDLEAYLQTFDTGMAPAVGYQLTFDGSADPLASGRLDTLRARAEASDCDLIARGRMNGQPHSWLYQGAGQWQMDVASQPVMSTGSVLGLADLGDEITVTGVPQGTGIRMALDRDRDTFYDGDELLYGSLSDDPNSTPLIGVAPGIVRPVFGVRAVAPNPFHSSAEVTFSLVSASAVDLAVYDVLGRETRVLAHARTFTAGEHRLVWDGRREDGSAASPGVYFVQLRVGSERSVRPMVRIR